jgi:hypothetical protein
MALTFGHRLGSRTLALLATAATMALVATAGCGGSVIGVGPTGDDAGRTGDDGDDGGRIGDDGDDGGRVNPACPPADGALNGTACQTSGLTCPSGIAERDCSGAIHDIECFCNGASWDCEVASVPNCVTPPPPPPPPPPPAQCPAPSMLVPGQACRAVGLTCLSDNVPTSGCGGPSMAPPEEGKCTCTSTGWQCPVIALPCVSPPPPPPPATCPSPDHVYAYGPCYGEGLNCAGNPQLCENETFYDALECEGEWIPIATTICADVIMDGGSADAPFYVGDAGPVFE